MTRDDQGVLVALFGFLGVIVGALASGASTWFFTRRREQHEKRTAARLVREDLLLAGSALDTVLQSGGRPEFALPLEYWREHRSVLAGSLSRERWEQVAIAMGSVERIEVMLASIGGEGAIAAADIPDYGRETIQETIEHLESANEALFEVEVGPRPQRVPAVS
jgi:ABC-type Fe3+-siderophore transport system permease subunit